jgi:hypothetical protein
MSGEGGERGRGGGNSSAEDSGSPTAAGRRRPETYILVPVIYIKRGGL